MGHDLDSLRRENERLEAKLAETETERDSLVKLNAIAQTIAAELDTQKLVRDITTHATELVGAELGAWIAYMDDQGVRYPVLAAAGAPREIAARLTIPYRSTVFEGKTVVRVDDITKEPPLKRTTAQLAPITPLERELALRSYLAVPIITRAGNVIGALAFGHSKPQQFTPHMERLIVGLSAQAATAMDNARLYNNAQRLITELERANAELDQFTYVASHDLRAPLRGIANLAMWIEEDLGTDLPPKIGEQLQLLRGRAARMDKLINALLELARIGRARQRPERVDVTELLHETIDMLGPEFPARVLIVGAMPTLVAERVALQQVLLNLIGNSLRHAGREDVEVRVTADERDTEVELAVSDNGVGIPVEHRERVWEIFQTLNPRDAVDASGTGLALVKKQVDANGGRAWIDEPPNGTPGVTVRFTWPKRPAQPR
ncbi:MAG: ATP-binding protein [Kofleriaceae bacterium]